MSITWAILNVITWLICTVAYIKTEAWEVYGAALIASVIHTAWSIWWENDDVRDNVLWGVVNIGVWLIVLVAILFTGKAILLNGALLATGVFALGVWLNK